MLIMQTKFQLAGHKNGRYWYVLLGSRVTRALIDHVNCLSKTHNNNIKWSSWSSSEEEINILDVNHQTVEVWNIFNDFRGWPMVWQNTIVRWRSIHSRSSSVEPNPKHFDNILIFIILPSIKFYLPPIWWSDHWLTFTTIVDQVKKKSGELKECSRSNGMDQISRCLTSVLKSNRSYQSHEANHPHSVYQLLQPLEPIFVTIAPAKLIHTREFHVLTMP